MTERKSSNILVGKSSDYPYESVRHRIVSMCGADSEAISEGMLWGLEVMLRRYADLAFKYCPDLHGLATKVSDDGNSGFMEIPTLSHRPVFHLLIVRADEEGVNYRFDCVPLDYKVDF